MFNNPRVRRLVTRISVVVLGVTLVVVSLAYVFDLTYLFKAVRVTYLKGHRTAYLDDYKYFDNHVVRTGVPQPWAVSGSYVERELSDTMAAFHEKIRSVAYLVVHRDSVVLERYFAGHDQHAISNSFSMAKSIVAAILGKVIESGAVRRLDQAVVDFVPEITGEYARQLTFRDLVTMSSGLRWDERYYSPFSITTKTYFYHDLPKAVSSLPVEREPGKSFKYQSGDTQLLGIALQRATRSTLSELLSVYFWQPMGMEREALWQVDSKESGHEKAYCCIAGSARDFARFGKLYLQKGGWRGDQLLSEAYVAESLRPRFKNSPEYGYGWWLGDFEGKPYFYMDGHLGQYVIVVPQDGLIVVRLGHQVDEKKKNDPSSDFYRFIADAYRLIGSPVPD